MASRIEASMEVRWGPGEANVVFDDDDDHLAEEGFGPGTDLIASVVAVLIVIVAVLRLATLHVIENPPPPKEGIVAPKLNNDAELREREAVKRQSIRALLSAAMVYRISIVNAANGIDRLYSAAQPVSGGTDEDRKVVAQAQARYTDQKKGLMDWIDDYIHLVTQLKQPVLSRELESEASQLKANLRERRHMAEIPVLDDVLKDVGASNEDQAAALRRVVGDRRWLP